MLVNHIRQSDIFSACKHSCRTKQIWLQKKNHPRSSFPPRTLITMRYLTLLAGLVSSAHALLNCDITIDGLKYDLKPLGSGEHFVSREANTPPSLTNTTWYINPCGALDNKDCPEGTQGK